jgi:Family of unknown function (DUF6325)
VDVLELEAVDSIAGLRDIDGDVGGLLSNGDIELASLAIQPGTAGIVLVIDDRWAKPLSASAHRSGGQIIAGERIPAARVEAVLADDSRSRAEGRDYAASGNVPQPPDISPDPAALWCVGRGQGLAPARRRYGRATQSARQLRARGLLAREEFRLQKARLLER